MMPNSDPMDRFVCPYLTLMIYSFSCTLFFVPTLKLITILPYNTPHIHVSHFVLTSFSDALVTFVSDQVTCCTLQPVLSTGSEQQGQNIRVRTVFLTLTTMRTQQPTRMMFIKHYAPNRCLCIKVANSIDHWVEDCRDVTKAGGGGDMYKEWKLL